MDQNFSRIFETLKKDFKTTVIHGDFGLSNILYQRQTLKINYDIVLLIGSFGYGLDFAKQMIKYYKEIDGYLERALLYKTTFALQEALYGVEHNDPESLKLE